jgi:hypothetical protein
MACPKKSQQERDGVGGTGPEQHPVSPAKTALSKTCASLALLELETGKTDQVDADSEGTMAELAAIFAAMTPEARAAVLARLQNTG